MMGYVERSYSGGAGPRGSNGFVAERFAAGETSGKSKNMFIDGDTVYSYGYHFAIARREGNIVYFNSDGYSVSTSGHQAKVRSALYGSGLHVIETPDCDPAKLFGHLTGLVYASIKLCERARSKLVDHVNAAFQYITEFRHLKEQRPELFDEDQDVCSVLADPHLDKAISRIKAHLDATTAIWFAAQVADARERFGKEVANAS